jgi:hypothetical protein
MASVRSAKKLIQILRSGGREDDFAEKKRMAIIERKMVFLKQR